MLNYFLGLDLGQAQDYTALAVVERKIFHYTLPSKQYHVRHLQRFKLGTSYPEIVDKVKAMYEKPPLRGQAVLVADATGVGRPVMDLFRKDGLRPIAVTITGGTIVNAGSYGFHVPKRDLITNLQVLFQSGSLKIAGKLLDADILIDELLNFKVKIDTRTAHDSYEAWREGIHDDLVLAVALACWYAERKGKYNNPVPKPEGW